MFLIIDSDEEAIIRRRRFLYANNMMSLGFGYRNLPDCKDIAEIEAVIINNPYDKLMPTHFCYTCHSHFPHIPVVAFRQPLRTPPPDYDAIDILIDCNLPPHKITEQLLLEVSRYHKRDIADHMAMSARDHILMESPTWSGNPIYLTQTERMIFRYLIDVYPRHATIMELLRYCMKPGTSPQPCIIATHIYHINQKAMKEFGKHIIHCPGGIGYRFLFDFQTPARY